MARKLEPAGHSVDCCGFTKRWSL